MNRKARRQELFTKLRLEEEKKLAARKHAKIQKLRHGLWQVRSGKYLYGNRDSFVEAIALRREIRASANV